VNKMRRVLDTAFWQRPIWYLITAPVWTLLALLYFAVVEVRRFWFESSLFRGVLRRQKHVAKAKTICVGNLLAGGSGKSPVVRAILLDLLQKNEKCALISRGYGSSWTDQDFLSAVEPSHFIETQQSFASGPDEALETFFWLEKKMGRKLSAHNFTVCLGSHRAKSWTRAAAQLGTDFWAVLDDGLQNYSLDPKHKVCVWPFPAIANMPLMSLPLGPFREGFGLKSITRLARKMDLQLWSRVILSEQDFLSPQNSQKFIAYSAQVKSHISRWGWEKMQHGIVIANLKPWQDRWPSHADLLEVTRQGNSLVLLGVANPDVVFNSFKNFCNFDAADNKFFELCAMKDHEIPDDKIVEKMREAKVILTTLKDRARFQGQPWLTQLESKIFVLELESKIVDFNGHPQKVECKNV
jgi:tetraacyldisaccharide 4'-kinase